MITRLGIQRRNTRSYWGSKLIQESDPGEVRGHVTRATATSSYFSRTGRDCVSPRYGFATNHVDYSGKFQRAWIDTDYFRG